MYHIIITNGNIKQYLYRHEVVKQDEKIPSGTIQEQINAISSFDFTIYPNNPCYDRLHEYTTKIEIYNTSKSRYDFKGRVLKVSPQMDTDGMIYKNVVCESRLAYFCDSVQPYAEARYFEGDGSKNGLQEFVEVLLNNHNAQVEEEKKIYMGNITVNVDATDSILKALNYEKTFDVIKKELLDVYGGEIDIREGKDGLLYFDYEPSFGSARATTLELAKNIESQSRDIDVSNIITRLIPLGAKKVITDDEGKEVETEERLTIGSINNGINYIEDRIAVQKYGIIYGTHEFADATNASELMSQAENWLASNNLIEVSDTITALELSLIDLDIDDFRLYDSYPVKNHLLGITDTLRIIKKTTNVIEPYASSFELGSSKKLMTEAIIDYENASKNFQQATVEIKSSIRATNSTLINYVNEKTSNITQTNEVIRLEVAENTVSQAEYAEFAETVRNILAMDENGTTMIFNTITEAISQVDGQAQSNYANILKYIRFEDGNIILGEVGNEITLTIANDRITFMQNGVEVAYLSDNNLYIGNAIIKAGGRLQLGNFAFVPRSDGSLSFLKVGD